MYRSGEELYERIPHVLRADPTLSERMSGRPDETDVAPSPSSVRSLRGKGSTRSRRSLHPASMGAG